MAAADKCRRPISKNTPSRRYRDLYHGPNLSFRETHSPAPSTVQIRPELRVMAAQEAAKQRAAAENKSEAIAHRSSSDRT